MSVEKALRNPSDVYDSPEKVLQDTSLTREQKLEILKIWEYDAREMEVAEEENMTGGSASLLRDVKKAQIELAGTSASAHLSANKQG